MLFIKWKRKSSSKENEDTFMDRIEGRDNRALVGEYRECLEERKNTRKKSQG